MAGISAQPHHGKGHMEQAIQSVVDWTVVPMARAVTYTAAHGFLFAVFALLWLAFAVAIIGNPGSLDSAWEWITGLPLIVQGIAWLLFLPFMVGLWVWESGWPMVARLLVDVSLAGWTLLMFLPRRPQSSER